MSINFAMWKTALWKLVKMDSKIEWDKLDIFSKWFIATRSAVTTVTVYACVIAGLLCFRDGIFSFLPWLIVTLGFSSPTARTTCSTTMWISTAGWIKTIISAPNMVFIRWCKDSGTKPQQLRWFVVSGVLAILSGVFALFYTHFSPIVIGLFAFGAIVLLFYTWPFKYLGLGELAIFLIWGPIMIAGVYIVLAQRLDGKYLERRPGRRTLRLECSQHQCRQTYRQNGRR